MDPGIVAAYIGAGVAIAVALIGVLQAVRTNRARAGSERNSALINEGASAFMRKKDDFLKEYAEFKSRLAEINAANPKDGTKAVQFAIDYFGKKARPFYLAHHETLGTESLDNKIDEILEIANTKDVNSPENHAGKRKLGDRIVSFCADLVSRVQSPSR